MHKIREMLRLKGAGLSARPIACNLMQSQYTIEVDQVTKGEWFHIGQSFEDINIYQVWSWGALRWGEGRLSHLILKDRDKIIAAAQLWIIKIPLIGSGIAYVKWGPLW